MYGHFRDEETFEPIAEMLSRERERDQLLDLGGHVILPQ